jgi:hypothetical protein
VDILCLGLLNMRFRVRKKSSNGPASATWPAANRTKIDITRRSFSRQRFTETVNTTGAPLSSPTARPFPRLFTDLTGDQRLS